MTFSYDNSLGEDLDRVRFLVSDTDSDDQLLQDEEIEWLLAEEGSASLAAYKAAGAIARKFARKVTKAVGDLRIQYSDRAKTYSEMAVDLQSDVGVEVPVGLADYDASVPQTMYTGMFDSPTYVDPLLRREDDV